MKSSDVTINFSVWPVLPQYRLRERFDVAEYVLRFRPHHFGGESEASDAAE